MKVFVSFHDNDEGLYREIKAAFKRAGGVDVYRRSLDGLGPGELFEAEGLYNTLNYPDLALAIISPHQCADPWFQLELPALFALESRLKPDLILPVLAGDVGEQQVPLYLRGREYVDLRSSAGEGLARLVELVTRASERNAPKVFLVHGHDSEAEESVASFIEGLGLEAVILHEQANRGRTIIEKLEHHVDARFVVVLLTPDDVGASRKDVASLRPRARQNVIFELGLFIGKLGRGRVCALQKGDIELPSDYHGVLPVLMGEGSDWESKLAEELRQAGCVINVNGA
jgi:predicted nucleotide-binding protein